MVDWQGIFVMPTITATNGRFLTGLTCGKFTFKELFSYGDSSTTNLSFRGGNFDEAFHDNARAHCEMPDECLFVDVSKDEPLANLIETHDPDQIWKMRVPIKLVGHLKNQQKNGEEEGPLLTTGGKNVFLCRSRGDNSLEFVEMWFENGTWKIKSQPYVSPVNISAGSRLFVADR